MRLRKVHGGTTGTSKDVPRTFRLGPYFLRPLPPKDTLLLLVEMQNIVKSAILVTPDVSVMVLDPESRHHYRYQPSIRPQNVNY